jgi:hypothetical protein
VSPLPTFVVLGAMKSGTTSLHRYLASHRDVFVPELKEIEFFSEEDRWRRGVQWYERLFEPGATARARGEVSTGYTKLPRYPEAAARLHALVPDARLLYLVREPIDRMRSHYVHNVLQGTEHRPIGEALIVDANYAHTSSYATQLARYLELFDRAQLLVVFAEQLRRERASTMATVFRFIGVDDHVTSSDLDEEHYASDARREVRPGLRRLTTSRRLRIVRGRMPAPVRRALGRIGQRDVTAGRIDDAISDAVRAELRERLAPEVAGLRELTGTLPDEWGEWP